MSCRSSGRRSKQRWIHRDRKRKAGIATFLGLILLLSFKEPALARVASAADYLFEVARDYYALGDYRQAVHELKKALLVNPQHQQALRYVQIIEQELGLPTK